MLQAQSGSREALDELFKSVQEPLFRYIVSLVNDKHLAEDILQEVFIRIYRKLRWLREPQASPELPRERILASAYAALNPDDRLWQAFNSEVEQLRDAVEHPGLGEVVRADVQHHRLELGRRVEGQRPLRVGEVARAQRGQPAVEPRLLAQPRDGVLPVLRLVDHRLELPAGAERAAHALHHHVMAARREEAAVDRRRGEAPSVGRPDEHRAARLVRLRDEMVAQEHGAVAHWDFH